MRFRVMCLTVPFLALAIRSLGVTTQPATQPTPEVAVEKLIVLDPTQGRARFIKPGDSFYFMFRIDKLDVPKVEVSLAPSLGSRGRVKLTAASNLPVAMQGSHWVMMLKTPADTPPGVYDIVIDLGIGYQRVPRAIKIIDRFKDRFRFIHLSNMNVGDPTAPDFDGRLVDEINLLNPEFIIATGDYLENPAGKINPEGWRRVKDFFRRFDAPCFILCGDQDDGVSYPVQVTPNTFGTLDYGPCHFFFMMDTSFQTIESDTGQIKALIADVGVNRSSTMTFLVGNRDNLGVLDGLKAFGREPAEVFVDGRIRYLLCGGSTDWDYREYAGKLAAANLSNVTYIRTGQSSTCMKNGGPGFSRYRVFDVSDSDVRFVYPAKESGAKVQSSVPAGMLRVFPQGPNDGTRITERVAVFNGLNQGFADCRVLLRLAGTDSTAVRVVNGRLERVLAGANGDLLVLVNVDLPAKTTVQVLATTDPATAGKFQEPPVKIDLAVPDKLELTWRQAPTGLRFLAGAQALELTLTNTSGETFSYLPQVTLNGQELIVQELTPAAASQPANAAATQPVPLAGDEGFALEPRKPLRLHVRPALRSAEPGTNCIQVYGGNDPLARAKVFPVQVEIGKE